MDTLSNEQISQADLTDWRKLGQALHARFRIPDYATAAEFLATLARAVGADGTHFDLRLTPTTADISVCTRQDGRWVTQQDVALAHRISAIARQHGLPPDPAAVTQLEIGLDTANEPAVGLFWSALLTGAVDNKIYDSVFDPTDRVPNVWFQATEEHPTPRQRWHFDLWLPPEVAADRIAAAVAAGGTVVYDGHAPAFTVLADPDGNRVCVCTSLGRD